MTISQVEFMMTYERCRQICSTALMQAFPGGDAVPCSCRQVKGNADSGRREMDFSSTVRHDRKYLKASLVGAWAVSGRII